MKSFSFNRYFRTLRWLLAFNYSTLLAWCAGSALVTLVVEILVLYHDMNERSLPSTLINDYGIMGFLFMAVMSAIMFSSVTRHLNKRCQRQGFLMLPATNAEKYLSLISYTLLSVVCIFLASALGDTLRMLYVLVAPDVSNTEVAVVNGTNCYWWSSAVPEVLKVTAPPFHKLNGMPVSQSVILLGYAFFFTTQMWIHSLYTVVGTLMRRYTFVISTLILIAAVILVVRVANMIDYTFFFEAVEHGRLTLDSIPFFLKTIPVVMLLLSVANYWASSYVFKNMELISKKWTNYDIFKR